MGKPHFQDSKCFTVYGKCTLGVQPSAVWEYKKVESILFAEVTSLG